MRYKGYNIIAEVNVEEQWDFTIGKDGKIYLTYYLDKNAVSENNITDFAIENPNGIELDEYPATLAEAKITIDKLEDSTNGTRTE